MQPARHTAAWQPPCLVQLGEGCLGSSTLLFGLFICGPPRYLPLEHSVTVSHQEHPRLKKKKQWMLSAASESHVHDSLTVAVCLRAVPGDWTKHPGMQTSDVDRKLCSSVHVNSREPDL